MWQLMGLSCKQVLDPGLTTTLLGSYGRLDDLVYYATLRQVSATRSYTHMFTPCEILRKELSHYFTRAIGADSDLVMLW